MARFSIGYLVLRRRGVWPCRTRSKTQSSGTRRKRNRACAIATCVLNAEFTNGVEPNLQGRRDLREQSLRNLRGGHTDRRIDRRTDSNGHGVTNGNGFLQKTSPKSEDHPKTEQTSTSEPTRSCADDCEPHSNGNNHSMSIKTDNTETDASNSKGDSSKKRIDNNNRQSPKKNQSRKQEVGQEQMEGQHDQPLAQEHESSHTGTTVNGTPISKTQLAVGAGVGAAGVAVGAVIASLCPRKGLPDARVETETGPPTEVKGERPEGMLGYYTGTLVNGKPHGFGRYDHDDWRSNGYYNGYIGKWKDGIGVAVRWLEDGKLGEVGRYEEHGKVSRIENFRELNAEEKKENTGAVQFFSYGKGFYSGTLQNGKPQGEDGEFILFTEGIQSKLGVKYKGKWQDGKGINLHEVEGTRAMKMNGDGNLVDASGDLVGLPCTLAPLEGPGLCKPERDYIGPVQGLKWPPKNGTTITDSELYKYYGEVKDGVPHGFGKLLQFNVSHGTRHTDVYEGRWEDGKGINVTRTVRLRDDSLGNRQGPGTFDQNRPRHEFFAVIEKYSGLWEGVFRNGWYYYGKVEDGVPKLETGKIQQCHREDTKGGFKATLWIYKGQGKDANYHKIRVKKYQAAKEVILGGEVGDPEAISSRWWATCEDLKSEVKETDEEGTFDLKLLEFIK